MLLNDEENILIEGILLYLYHNVTFLIVCKSIYQVSISPYHVFTIPIHRFLRWNALLSPYMLTRVLLVDARHFQKNWRLITWADGIGFGWTSHILKNCVCDDILFDTKLIARLRFTLLSLLVIRETSVAAATLSKITIMKAPLSFGLIDTLLAIKLGIALNAVYPYQWSGHWPF